MRALLWLLATATLAVALATAAIYNDGYALIVLPPWRVEISLNLLVVGLLTGFVALHLLLRLVSVTLRLPRTVEAFRARRRRERAGRALRDAVRMLFEGRYGHALKRAKAAHGAGESPGLASLVAARSARALREDEGEREWMEKAASHDDEVLLARRMTEVELDLDARRFDQARAALERLLAAGQRNVAAQRLALRVYQAVGDWPALLRVVKQLEKHRALPGTHAASLRQRAHLETIRQFASDAATIDEYWRKLPAAERTDPRVAAATVSALIKAGDCSAAQRIIEKRLDDEWDPRLVAYYGECVGGDALARITRAERWLKNHPQDATLLRVLGTLCRRLKLWGKAQSYLEAALSVAASPATHMELAALFDELERSEEAQAHYRAAAAVVPTGAAAVA